MLGSQDRDGSPECIDAIEGDGVQARAWHRCRRRAISESVPATRSYRPYRLPAREATSAEGAAAISTYSRGHLVYDEYVPMDTDAGACGCGDVDVMGSASAAECGCGRAEGSS